MVNADQLRANGIFVPRLGFDEDFLLGGHSNIARELSEDVLYNPRFGTVTAILDKLAAAETHTAILSSELFEFLHARPNALKKLADALHTIGYEAKIIVYLRSRPHYIESLYSQMLRHGLDCPFDEYLEYVLQNGSYESTDGFTIFQFEYSKIVAAFASVFGVENLIVKPYGTVRGAAFLNDFLDTIGFPSGERRNSLDVENHSNPTLTFSEALDLLYANAKTYAGASDPTPAQLLASLYGSDVDFAKDPFSVIDQRDISLIVMRFATDTLQLLQGWGFALPAVVPRTNVTASKKRRDVLRHAAAQWNLRNYRQRCAQRYQAGMLPTNIVEAAQAAMECP
jgi:hypothetical protein